MPNFGLIFPDTPVVTAPISIAATANVVAGVSGKRIKVLALTVIATAAESVTVNDGVSSAFTGAMSFAANGGLALSFNPHGYFETSVGNALRLILGGTNGIEGFVTYQLVD